MKWPTGKFVGQPVIRWLRPSWYVYLPLESEGFSFLRANGEIITPGHMMTDAGSIPRLAWSIPDLDPWCYLPAYIVHDWEFGQHHLGVVTKTFEEVNATLAEGISTLISTGVCPGDELKIDMIHAAVSSVFGGKIWDG